MKELILLRGLPGAGKSTLAKRVCNQHIEADMFFMKLFFIEKIKEQKKVIGMLLTNGIKNLQKEK